MKNSQEKIYIGNGKASEKFGDDIIEGTICLDQVQEAFTFEYEGKKYFRFKVVKKKTPKFDNTHSVLLDTYKPNEKEAKNPKVKKAKKASK